MNDNVSGATTGWIMLFCAAVIVFPFVFQFIKDVTSKHKVPPHQRYCEAINKYYTAIITGQYLNSDDIPLPSPWQPEYCKQPDIWNQPGWWQDQWRLFAIGKPSVYSGEVALPHPYAGRRDSLYAPNVWFYDVDGRQTSII